MKVNILNQLRHVYNNLYQMKVNILNQLRHVYKQNIRELMYLIFNTKTLVFIICRNESIWNLRPCLRQGWMRCRGMIR